MISSEKKTKILIVFYNYILNYYEKLIKQYILNFTSKISKKKKIKINK